jgi:hypothetical protein
LWRDLLLRSQAWRSQERAFGGHDKTTLRLLEAHGQKRVGDVSSCRTATSFSEGRALLVQSSLDRRGSSEGNYFCPKMFHRILLPCYWRVRRHRICRRAHVMAYETEMGV